MEHTAGMFTITTRLLLTPQHRQRLEYAVRSRRIDPADFVSALLVGNEPAPIEQHVNQERTASIPIRVYMTSEQRDTFRAFASAHETDMSVLISEVVAHALADLPDPPTPLQNSDHKAESRAYRRELARIQARRATMAAPPFWLDQYIADLEDYVNHQSH